MRNPIKSPAPAFAIYGVIGGLSALAEWRVGGIGAVVFSRPENWGLIIAPILAVGLCFTPRALTDLARAMRGRQSATSAA